MAQSSHTRGDSRFPELLKAAMREREVSHRGLAAAIGASKQSVTNWTQGRNEPSLRHLRKIANFLGVPIVSLLEDPDADGRAEEVPAIALLRELTSQPIGPAMQSLAASAPDLSDLLTRAERYVKTGGEGLADR